VSSQDNQNNPTPEPNISPVVSEDDTDEPNENVERIILTLGGIFISEEIHQAVADFNKTSRTHHIDDLKTPHIENDEEGNLIEISHYTEILSDGHGGMREINIYAMTDNEVMSTREIVESANILARSIHPGLWDLIAGDIDSFFADVRSAEDTARIIQDRVSTYLSERS
jgi:hypothetical protein